MWSGNVFSVQRPKGAALAARSKQRVPARHTFGAGCRTLWFSRVRVLRLVQLGKNMASVSRIGGCGLQLQPAGTGEESLIGFPQIGCPILVHMRSRFRSQLYLE